jgi:hypothetical protein
MDGTTLPADCFTSVDCDDGEACTGVEVCVDGACEPGEPIACPDDDPCDGTDACVDGECVTGDAPTCAGPTACGGLEECVPGIGCQMTVPDACDDSIDCTIDSCGPMGCENVPDDTLCTVGAAGVCDAASGCQYAECNDTTCASDACWERHCESDTCTLGAFLCDVGETCCDGACVPIGCEDGNLCTRDACVAGSGCVSSPLDGSCSDGDPCTMSDVCAGGVCVGGGIRGCSDGNPCTMDDCVTGSGCRSTPASGLACSDGDPCTVGDMCASGVCIAGTGTAVCDDGNPCTVGSCTSMGCAFMSVTNGTRCGVNAVCTAGVCGCASGYDDCNRDGVCECTAGACVGSLCSATVVDCLVTGCMMGELCCDQPTAPAYGTCFPSACLACCMPAA